MVICKNIDSVNVNYEKAIQGHCYAVGVGPGAPDLLTIRAVRIIETADVIVAPRSSKADTSLALETVRHLLHRNQTIIDHQYAMIRDEEITIDRWKPVAETMADYCQSGKSVVQITIGDPLIYSTVSYVLPFLFEKLGEDKIHVIPGISAFQISASKFGMALTLQEDRLCIMPATDIHAVSKALDNCETLVLYKCAKQLHALAELLTVRNLDKQCRVVCYAEQDQKETVYNDIHTASASNNGYMATAIIFSKRKKWM
jgi:precorrin-2/cobalt-factor-2 C20-methyltransferase